MKKEEFDKHVTYLKDTTVSFEEKKENYKKMADTLATWQDFKAANVIWSNIRSALAYASNLTTLEKLAIDGLFKPVSKGENHPVYVLEQFSRNLRREEVNIEAQVLYKYTPKEIVLARELCYKFLAETEGERLEEMIYNIALFKSRDRFDNVGEYELLGDNAYEVYSEFALSDLVPDEDKARLLRFAREEFLNE